MLIEAMNVLERTYAALCPCASLLETSAVSL